MSDRRPKICRCGHEKGDPMVVEEPEYTLWGWILLSMFGVTPKPDHVVYRCQICRQSLGVSRNPAVLARRSPGYAVPPPAEHQDRVGKPAQSNEPEAKGTDRT